MLKTILCSHCNKPVAKGVYVCSKCSNVFCDSCTIEKNGKYFCVTCFSSNLSKGAIKVLNQALLQKGTKLEFPELVFNGIQIKELSEIRISQDQWEFKVKCVGRGGEAFDVDKNVFDELWKKAQDLGYKPEKIPFGQRIVI